MFSVENRVRKQELLSLITQGSTDKSLFDELMTLNTAEEQSKVQRQGLVEGLLKSMAELDVQFSEVHSAFSKDQIEEVAITRGIMRPGSRDVRSSRSSAGNTNPHSRVSRKKGEALITAHGGNGFAATYNRGQTLPYYVPTAFKTLFERSGAMFESELAQKFTEAGKTYFATDEGQKDLAAFINYVKVGKGKQRQGGN